MGHSRVDAKLEPGAQQLVGGWERRQDRSGSSGGLAGSTEIECTRGWLPYADARRLGKLAKVNGGWCSCVGAELERSARGFRGKGQQRLAWT